MDCTVFAFVFSLLSSYVTAQLGCVTPPMECPNENITFWLYTRSNEDQPHQLLAMDADSIKSAPWVEGAPIKILIHGYTGHKDYSPNTEIRPAYMNCCDYNIISVDYNPIARSPCYIQAADNTELVGKCIAQLIDQLVTEHRFDLPKFHVIGFSLGGQTAGYISNFLTSGRLERLSGALTKIYLKYTGLPRSCLYFPSPPRYVTTQATQHSFDLQKFHVIVFSLGGQVARYISNFLVSGKLERGYLVNLAALDPALPLFVTLNKKKKVDSGDAKYVDCLHTNALERGKLETCGVSDWFANGGVTQPGCMATEDESKSSCNHARAPAYYAESITTDVGFYGTKCNSGITYVIGGCNAVSSDEDVLYGEWMTLNASGLYFFATNSESPYARGHN